METLDLKQMSAMVDIIAEEKGLPRDTVISVIEQAIAAAWRKDNGDRDMNVRAVLNTNTGEADVFVAREVIEDGLAYNTSTEIPLSQAGEGAALGDIVEEKHVVKDFGRVAAMTAKQVFIQRLREAENNAVLAEYEDKIGTVVTGMITRVEPRIVRIDLGRASGIMPRSEQIDGEYYTVGSRIKVYIKNIEKADRGAQLVLSRGCAEFVEYLFRQEVPEIDNGTVEIKGIAREAGRRTKIAVASTTNGVDPVGTFVGGRGIRVQAVMNEIGDREKIDIVTWSDNPSEYIREALSPAEINKVEIEDKHAKVYVTEDQQSIAIGKQGQNVRLASKLTGYDLDIELIKSSGKKKKKNVEDSLLSALEEDDKSDPKPTEEIVEEVTSEEPATEAETPTSEPAETPTSEAAPEATEEPTSETAAEAVGETTEE
ncbi:transcription termination/antitermination protein NusA [Candidatus Saccharibacteria bacterium]|nr:transcription termination/antitermination protein NusA [Candidatus Saccharibacteria bacterium]